MSVRKNASIVLGFPNFREPAKRMADKAEMAYADIHIHRFPDGESLVRLPDPLPERAIFYSSFDDANRQLIELELAAATALQLGAKQLTLVAPYLCYMRQDKAFNPGEAVSQRIIGEFLARRFDTLITVDPHLHRTRTLAEAVPVRRAVTLSAAPVISVWLARRSDNPLLIGPDEESEQWVSAIAAPGGLDYGVARKTRLGDSKVVIKLPELAFANRNIMLIDDVASTGHTLAEAARQIKARGAASVSVFVTHALFASEALSLLRDAGIGEICSTDSVLHETNRAGLADALAAALIEHA